MKDIPGYEGIYAVTEDGRVWSYPRKWLSGFGRCCSHDGRFLSLSAHSGGYQQVALTKNKQSKRYFVHRLVATTYLSNPLGKTEVNHKDANKKNNHFSNLEWATRRENSDHAKDHSLYRPVPTRGSKHPDAKISEIDVLRIRELRDQGYTLTMLMKLFPLSKSAMYAVCSRQSWTHV